MTASRPADITAHNKPLHEAMLARGCKWVSTSSKEYFTLDGEYEAYPAGYIRGPQFHENGNPRPYSYSVQGRDGWLQRSFTHQEVFTEGVRWALETAQAVLIPINNCGGVGECCGCEVCTPDEPYERESCEACDSSGQNDDGSECKECKGFGDKIIDGKPNAMFILQQIYNECDEETWEEIDSIDDGQRISVSICAADLKQLRDAVKPWQTDNDRDSAGIEVAQEALDIAPPNKTTVGYLMLEEFELECVGYKFPECHWDSFVGRECMKVIRKAQELIDMMPDVDYDTTWTSVFEQCDIFFCG